MKKRDCWIKSAAEREELKKLFLKIDQELSEAFEQNPNMREEHLEGRFGGLFEKYSPLFLKRINDIREMQGLCRIQIGFNYISNKEKIHGADLGLVVQIDIPELITIKKAVLVQSKRLHPIEGEFAKNCIYEEVFKKESTTVAPQWVRMQEITSASVYFFYNPDRLKIGRHLEDFRTRIINAQIIEGKANAGLKSLSAETVLENGVPFSDWIVENFICCNIGDTSKKAIETAFGENEEFSVRHTFKFVIEKEHISIKNIK